MPRKDKSGPEGQGPLTGRGLGGCNDKKEVESKSGQGKRRGVRRERKNYSK